MSEIQEIKRKSGIRFRVGKMIKGKRFSKVFKTLSSAEAYRDKMNLHLSGITFKKMSYAYLDQLDTSSRDSYRKSKMYTVLGQYLTLNNIEDYNHKNIEQILVRLMEDRGICSRTLDRYKSAISGVFELAVANEFLYVNPAINISYVKCKEGNFN